MIYHLLPELEPFSMLSGGALSRDVAYIMPFDGSSVVTGRGADDSWGYERSRIVILPKLHIYRSIPRRRLLPLGIHCSLIRLVFREFTERLAPGDIVWCHNQPFFAAALAPGIREAGAKLIYHIHDGHAGFAVRAAFGAFHADAYFVVSEAMREKWSRLFPGLTNAHVIHNGVDEKLFHPLSHDVRRRNDPPVILFVGRLAHEKGPHVLIEAIRILEERGVSALCKIVGTSACGWRKSTRYARELYKSAPKSVRFLGYVANKQLPDLYRAADIVCSPSLWQEPFGNVNIEAMACGIPVVATAVGGIPEIAAEGGVVLVEPDSPVQLADALQKLVFDSDLRGKIAEAGVRSVLRRFTWFATCQQYLGVINSL
jgi:spore coat protein SA